MTIKMEDLEEGQHYEGFLWHKGSQKGIATLPWSGERFYCGMGVSMPHVDDRTDRSWKWAFEPNIKGVNADDRQDDQNDTA